MDNVKYLRIRFSDSVIIRLQSYINNVICVLGLSFEFCFYTTSFVKKALISLLFSLLCSPESVSCIPLCMCLIAVVLLTELLQFA